jgi:hypothetical protein
MAHSAALAPGWVRDREFDLGFVVGVAAVALLCGMVVVAEPRLFVPLMLLDVWLLGYHHVISTWTRIACDRESFRTHRHLVLGLPPLVILGTFALGLGLGMWAIATLYLYWQWFHYTRQSWGVARIYQRKAGVRLVDNDVLERIAFYAVPVWGILHRSHQAPETFLGAELALLPVPALLVDLAAVVAAVAVAGWAVRILDALRRGELPVAYALYVTSHLLIFFVGYVAIGDIDHGWLVINVWHNAQYILFVWLFNAKRFADGPDPAAPMLSRLSQPHNAPLYLAACVGVSTLLYLSIDAAVGSMAIAVVIYQALNFHHYIVDGRIWKVRSRPLRETLGLAPTGDA